MGKIYDSDSWDKNLIGLVESDGKVYDSENWDKNLVGLVESPHIQRSGAALLCIIR